MLKAVDAEAPVKVEFDNFEHGFPEGFGPGRWGHLAYAVGIVFAAFQLYVAAFNYFPSQVVRGVHVGFLILMTFGLIGNFTAKSNAGRAAGWLIGSAGFLCGLYQWIFYADLIARDGDPTRLDLVVGTLLAVLIFEGTRRLMGLALPLMCGICLLYWFFGQYLPAPLNHRGYDFDQVITQSMAQVVASNNLMIAATNEGAALLIRKTKEAEAEGASIRISACRRRSRK